MGDGTPARNNQREYTVRNEKMVLMGYCVKSECTIEGLRETLYKHWPNPSTGTKALSERRVRAGFSYYVRVSYSEHIFTMQRLGSLHHPPKVKMSLLLVSLLF